MNDPRSSRKRHRDVPQNTADDTISDDSGDIIRRHNKSRHGSQADIKKVINDITGYEVPNSLYWRVQKGATEVRTPRFIFTFTSNKPTDWVLRVRRNTGR